MTIEELEAYFDGIELPAQIDLEAGVVIADVPLFLESHLSYVKNSGSLKSADVFVKRLHQLHDRLEQMNQQRI
ncbi:DUF6965 family protein [Pedobacter antarcticus]|uniref:DUF6965 domain-containing protein n=2 Tax=Pedobacter antarcticus TaxID=34086 RepID=A0A081PJG8_9SPHI|nr:hypothetical protein [Pedobacter antarcticus]KEQ30841.1 hypothetical protein N180_15930 [Pedobacter antarcticus 4BY]SDL79770.1 hypothetical protein SAMN04488084_102490 [Pedobacter antarcticus]SFF00813.1 hypothetical protein SAMN03003324_02060 [Pedobacter antarcticus]